MPPGGVWSDVRIWRIACLCLISYILLRNAFVTQEEKSIRLPANANRRNDIRRTYMTKYADFLVPYGKLDGSGTGAVYAFIVSSLETLGEEQTEFQDLIEVDCPEVYDLLTLKTLGFFHWAGLVHQERCQFDFVMKTDDDSYIRVDALLEFLKDKPREKYYWGHYWSNGAINDPGYPSYAPRHIQYMGGAGYVVSKDLVRYVAGLADSQAPLLMPKSEDVAFGLWIVPLRVQRDNGGAESRGEILFSLKGQKCPKSAFVVHLQWMGSDVWDIVYQHDVDGKWAEWEVIDW